jgi:hypothetical protein
MLARSAQVPAEARVRRRPFAGAGLRRADSAWLLSIWRFRLSSVPCTWRLTIGAES